MCLSFILFPWQSENDKFNKLLLNLLNLCIKLYMEKIVIIGGTSGLGLSIAIELRSRFGNANILLVGKTKPVDLCNKHNLNFLKIDLSSPYYDWKFCVDSNFIVYAAGVGRITSFDEIDEKDVHSTISVNATNVLQLINSKKKELISLNSCQISIVTSIAGKVPSPLFALYAASKALVSSYISSINIELAKKGTKNRITEIAPGYIDGTGLYGQKTNLDKLASVSKTILNEIEKKKYFIIPQNEKMYLEIIERAHKDPQEFGFQSYDYKLEEKKKRT